MIIAAIYSFKNGEDIIRSLYPGELQEVEEVIAAIDSTQCKTKISREKTMPGRTLYNPRALNRSFTKEFERRGWKNTRCNAITLPATMSLALSPKVHPKVLSAK